MEDLTASSIGSSRTGGTQGRPEGSGARWAEWGHGGWAGSQEQGCQGACGPAVGILRPSSVMINYTRHTRICSPFEIIITFQIKVPAVPPIVPLPQRYY